MIINMDGTQYHLRVLADTWQESFELKTGRLSDELLDGTKVREIIGTSITPTMQVEPDPQYYQEYIDFCKALERPIESHAVEVDHLGQTLAFRAIITGGTHTVGETIAGKTRYKGLTVTFEAQKPQILP